jgi:hypothetical protein
MADDDVIDEEDLEALGGDLDEEELVDDDDVIDADALDGDDVLDDAVIVDDDAEVVPEETPKARKKRDEEEDDEEELDPDDVEADLDRILKDRIAATEDEEDDEELEQAPRTTVEAVDGVLPKKANEFTCTGCFLLVNPGQFGPPDAMECPVGEGVCPAIQRLRKQYAKAKK